MEEPSSKAAADRYVNEKNRLLRVRNAHNSVADGRPDLTPPTIWLEMSAKKRIAFGGNTMHGNSLA